MHKPPLKFIFITVFIIVLILVLISVLFITTENPLTHQTIKIILKQEQDDRLSIKEIKVEDKYPEQYKLNPPTNYYVFEIDDKNGQKLFSGKVVNKEILYYFPLSEDNLSPPRVTTIDEITVYLPFYTNAERIRILDEKEQVKLELALKEFNLQPLKTIQNLCGNGICDANENIVGCFSDCKYQFSAFKKAVTEKLLP